MARRIVIADDHPLMRAAVRASVESVWPHHDIVEVSDAGAAHREVEQGGVELVTLDLHMSDSAGLGPLMDLRKKFPAVPVVIISASEDQRILRGARELGASAFISKTASLEQMSEALAQVSEGELWFPRIDEDEDSETDDQIARLATLTPTQTRILQYLAEGMLNKQIAYEMTISEATVKAHITAIFRRLGVINRTQAVLVAKQLDAPQQSL
ncbi:MAG: response regulator transcription factor [Sphingomonadales bacterium]|nr:response regulator transcription factor [Sphingomonadales bacterium]MBD3773422.1 response regulator transcription factor [Paracoccaceae bacterium]